MKHLLLFSAMILFTSSISAQDYVFTGDGDGTSWHDPENWNTDQVPGAVFSEVIIPQGETVTNTGSIVFNFGTILGGGTIINDASFTFLGLGIASKSLSNISFINNATIFNNVPGIGTLLTQGAIITNTATGTIIFDGVGMSSNAPTDKLINNGGLIRSIHPNDLQLLVILENNNGTIEVEAGDLFWATGNNNDVNVLQDGIYNVSENATFRIADFTLQGTYHGQVDGVFAIQGVGANITTLSDTLINEIEGNGLTFYFGSILGGGTLINNTKFNVTNDGGGLGKMISNITIINNAEFNSVQSANNTSWGLWDGSQLINETTGTVTIGLGFNGNTGVETLHNNGGTVITTNDVGLGVNFTNSGLFEYGPYDFNFAVGSVLVNNTIDGTFSGTGQLNLNIAQPLINNGIFTSGQGVSKTFIYNGFRQDAGARLHINIDGNTPETEYDVIQADNGGAFEMNGTIEVTLGFAPEVDDEFRVLFSINRAVVCNLPETISASFEGMVYTFDVICEGSDVTLKVSDISVGIKEQTLENISLYPNPSSGGAFSIDLDKTYAGVTVQTSNMLGQIVSTEKYASAKLIQMEIAGPAGIYFVNIRTSEGTSGSMKMIKN